LPPIFEIGHPTGYGGIIQPTTLSRNESSTQCKKIKGLGGHTEGPMKSPVVKRSINIGVHRTSVSLEDAFWSELKEIAHNQGVAVSKLVAQIEDTRQQGNLSSSNLSSALRLYVLEHIRSQWARQGKN
jgi:predicted DNA-binding ribbon-helix-helix protein